MDVTTRLRQLSTRYPDDGDEIFSRLVLWSAWVSPEDRADYEAGRAALWEEVQTAYAQGGVEGVRVLAGRVLYAWTAESVSAIQAAANKAGDEEMSAICGRYFEQEDREILSEADRDAIWHFLDEMAETEY